MLPALFHACTEQLRTQGIRRLWVLSGSDHWCESCLREIREAAPGDWPVISAELPDSIPAGKARLLPGQEFLHGVFDARRGLHSEALAMLTGTLQAGSWLILLLPPESQWQTRPDDDSLRWNDGGQMIPAPHFMRHFARTLIHPAHLCRYENRPFDIPLLPPQPAWLPPDGTPTPAQQQILDQLRRAESGIFCLTAARGRGKSAVAGLFLADTPGRHLLCAPAKVSVTVIQRYLDHSQQTEFISPDNLLILTETADTSAYGWLVIDEAAMIPLPLLTRFATVFPRILLLTTVQGYEGTGRGFLLKFCHSLPQFTALTLTQPVRWAEHDPAEAWLDEALLLTEPAEKITPAGECEYLSVTQQALCDDPDLLSGFYGLLTAAHYRTSPLDLRRLADAPGQHFALFRNRQQVTAALWLTDEGGLSAELTQSVWAGTRRPRGNLLAQSLAAHSYFPQAAQLRSRRISRIAVHAGYRRNALGRQLLQRAAEAAKNSGMDYLSVSFGYTPELAAFWSSCGFRFVRTGTHTEAVSGCYTAMLLLPLTPAGQALADAAEHQFARDCAVYSQIWGFSPVLPVQAESLNEQEWRMLAGFAYAAKPQAVAEPALVLLQREYPAQTAELSQLLSGKPEMLKARNISGKKALLDALRQETATVLQKLRPQWAQQTAAEIRAF
ncbi:tRNA(Met) cytidine acetyltransferase TmcA [Morganella morganii]|uniref:tRNA(Met) cytidine acetyltransferase TmcA n=1 Tax=Morganella morganii TaxID=582 RepID=UPI001C4931F0|nr:GNAT family N-acetyltransferase [Morganella morganii]QXO71439.1 GNAT family N-acetyltransferase [Morganella morganii]